MSVRDRVQSLINGGDPSAALRTRYRDAAMNWIALGVLLSAWHMEGRVDRTLGAQPNAHVANTSNGRGTQPAVERATAGNVVDQPRRLWRRPGGSPARGTARLDLQPGEHAADDPPLAAGRLRGPGVRIQILTPLERAHACQLTPDGELVDGFRPLVGDHAFEVEHVPDRHVLRR